MNKPPQKVEDALSQRGYHAAINDWFTPNGVWFARYYTNNKGETLLSTACEINNNYWAITIHKLDTSFTVLIKD